MILSRIFRKSRFLGLNNINPGVSRVCKMDFEQVSRRGFCTKNPKANGENVLSEVLESIARADANIKTLSDEIDQLLNILNKPLNAWSVHEVETYVSKEVLRIREGHLRIKDQQLRAEKEQLRRIQQGLLGQKSIDLAVAENVDLTNQKSVFMESEVFKSERLTTVSFPFFTPNGERDFNLFEGDRLVTEINRCVSKSQKQKFAPIIITTSRGMGKTFFLKMFGLQKLQDELKSPLIQEALSLGRVVSFDFSADIFSTTNDIYTFVQRLMIFFLCHLFAGKQVDSINFEGIKDF